MAKFDYIYGVTGMIIFSLMITPWNTINNTFPDVINKVANQVETGKKVAVGHFAEDEYSGKILGADVFEEILQLDSNAVITVDGVTLNKLTREGMPLLTYCREVNSSELIYGAAGISIQRYYDRTPIVNSDGIIIKIDYKVI